MRIDLHTHSAESDGTDTPARLVDVAIGAGLDVIALTDHDTTAGWQAAAEAVRARPGQLRLVPGAELSCACPNGRGGTATVHLLAYLFDATSPTLAAEQSRLRAERRERLRKMAGAMAEAGFPVDPDDVMDRLPADSPGGRPHLARALVRGGAVASVDEAFDRYLHSAGPYYLPRADTPVRRAIEMITEAGGVTVLAHPFAPRGSRVTADVIRELAGCGLTGVEVDHPDHGQHQREQLRALAGELGLVPTGSSDYHGTNKTLHIGQEQTPPASLERLVELATGSSIVG
ncbi:PHP domain-containing protein [Salinifilum ghardaiensis]